VVDNCSSVSRSGNVGVGDGPSWVDIGPGGGGKPIPVSTKLYGARHTEDQVRSGRVERNYAFICWWFWFWRWCGEFAGCVAAAAGAEIADEVRGIGWCAGIGERGRAVGFSGKPVTVATDDVAINVPVESHG